jgi:hypothetical protein
MRPEVRVERAGAPPGSFMGGGPAACGDDIGTE